MSFKSVLAGPSRTVASIPRSHILAATRHLTIPHPDLTLPEGTTGGSQFQIKTSERIPDVLTVFACIRAAEKALGSSVISIDVDRDTELLKPVSFIHITTLRPVEFAKPILLSIVPPKTTTSDVYGGPSLEDFRTVFRSEAKEPTGDQKGFRFRIEMHDGPAFRPKPHRGVTNWKAIKQIREENERVLDALEDLGGGWREIADKWAHLRSAGARRSEGDEPRSQGARQTGGGQDIEELGSKAKERADRREAKHRRHDQEDGDANEHPDEEDGTLESRRERSRNTREKRHQQKVDSEAERLAEAEAVSDWKFAIGDGQTETQLPGALALSPEEVVSSDPQARFSLSHDAARKVTTTTEDVPAVMDEKAEEFARKEEVARSVAEAKRRRAEQQEADRKDRFKQKALEQARKDAQAKAYLQRKSGEPGNAGRSVSGGTKAEAQSARDAGSAMDDDREERRNGHQLGQRQDGQDAAEKNDKEDGGSSGGLWGRLFGPRP